VAELPASEAAEREPGLKQNAIGFVDALVIGLASTAPAYSLAAVIGIVVVIAGVQAPAVLLASFVPMFFIAAAFYYMNRADQDCGTTFSWVTRALGPWPGWLGGWAICTTGILVVGSLADVAARYFYLLIGADGAADSKAAVTILAVAIIAAMTLVCVLGTDLSARFQNILIGAQVGALLLFAVVAIVKVAAGDAPEGSIDPSLSWLNPFEIDETSALIAGLLTGVFIYWGWESAVNLTEEVEDSASAPGRAAVLSTVILLVTYVAVVAFAGLDRIAEFEDDDAILSTLATDVLGTPWDQLVVLAVLTSALASTQTTILPASRTTLSMGRAGAMPRALAHIHPRFQTPNTSTWLIGGLAAVWYAVVNSLSENFLFDTLSALSLMIAFYYALSGIACVVYYRHELTNSVRNFLFIGVAPLAGAIILAYLLVRSVMDLSDPEESYSGSSVLGVGVPLFIGAAFLLLGAILMVVWRFAGPPGYFERRPFEALPRDFEEGEAAPELAETPAGRS
jgi:amino acid transporter